MAGLSDGWRDQVRTRAESAHAASVLIGLVERLERDLGVRPKRATGKKQSSLALLPPAETRGRIGAITIGSGRFYAHFPADRIDVHHSALPGTQIAESERVWLTTYVRTPGDVDRAVEMIRHALLERGLEPNPEPASERPDDRRSSPEPLSVQLPPREDELVGTDGAEPPTTMSDAEVLDRTPVSAASTRRATQVVDSEHLQAARATLGSRAPAPDRTVAVLALLIDARSPVSFGRVARVAGVSSARVAGLLAVLDKMLTVDGVATLAVDRSAQEVRLRVAEFEAHFPPS